MSEYFTSNGTYILKYQNQHIGPRDKFCRLAIRKKAHFKQSTSLSSLKSLCKKNFFKVVYQNHPILHAKTAIPSLIPIHAFQRLFCRHDW